ncbi:peptidoglycan DD-metalloendopeptidase family protein [Patescibacteria group bacterium]
MLTTWPLLEKGIPAYLLKTGKRFKSNFRGSSRDPLLYLAVFAVLLFGLATIKTSFIFPGDTNQNPGQDSIGRHFFAAASQETDQKNLFLSQNNIADSDLPSLNIIQNNSLVGMSPPILVSPQVLGNLGTFYNKSNEIVEYAVESGDSLSSIAEKFGISLNTLLWANDLSQRSLIPVGQKLVILPVSGTLHHVKNGETIGEIAQAHKGDTSEIVSFNDLAGENIFIGDILVIPGGTKPVKPVYAAAPRVPLANSYFILPTQGVMTQGLHWYNAVDIANNCGTPVVAAAEGTVLSAKYGYNGGAGNYVKILHPNGIVTMYGHLKSIIVNSSQSVSQGQIIGLIGGQPGTPGAGISTGCHLHFEVRGARNPF